MEHIYGVWAVRSAASMFGHAEAWCKEDGRPLEFESLEAAQAYALELNRKATVNVRYFVKEKEPEPNAVRVPASQPDIEAVGPVDHVPRNEVAEKHNGDPRQADGAGGGSSCGDPFCGTQQLCQYGRHACR